MANDSLDYRLLHPSQPVDPRTQATIMYTVERLTALMDHFGQQDKTKRIVVDNVAVSMARPASGVVTAAGCVPRDDSLYLYSRTAPSIKFPLPKPLEEMTREEAQTIAMQGPYGNFNPQLFVALRDYALEEP